MYVFRVLLQLQTERVEVEPVESTGDADSSKRRRLSVTAAEIPHSYDPAVDAGGGSGGGDGRGGGGGGGDGVCLAEPRSHDERHGRPQYHSHHWHQQTTQH